MRYVDGYVIPVPKKKLRVYQGIARKAGAIWKEHGAFEYRECAGDNLDNKWGMPSSSAQAEARRDSGLRLDRVQIARRSRFRQHQGDERPAPGEDDGSEEGALRHEAHGLRRLYRNGRCFSAAWLGLMSRRRLQLGDLVVEFLGQACGFFRRSRIDDFLRQASETFRTGAKDFDFIAQNFLHCNHRYSYADVSN